MIFICIRFEYMISYNRLQPPRQKKTPQKTSKLHKKCRNKRTHFLNIWAWNNPIQVEITLKSIIVFVEGRYEQTVKL